MMKMNTNINHQVSKISYKTTAEVLAIYLVALITFLTFFESINITLYTVLGMGSLLAFFTIIFAMISYSIYNIIIFLKVVANK